MKKDNRRDLKTPLEYYEKAILQLTQTQEELQEELKTIRAMKVSHEDLKAQIKEAKEEIKTLRERLKISEEQKEVLEQVEKQLKSNEKNTTYFYEEIQRFKQEVARVKTDISKIEIEAKEAKETAHKVFNIVSEMPYEPDETKITRIEKNTNYLYEEIESLRNEIDRVKNSGQNNNYLYDEVQKLQEALEIKQKQLNKAQKEINLASIQTSELSAKLNEISQNANTSRTLPYRKLERYLMTRQWKKADKETFIKIQELLGKVGYSRLSEEDLSRLLCYELSFIDQLWLKYSQGHFGLSVQKRIYQNIGGNRNIDREIWKKFGKRVGWYVNHKWIWYGDINFSRDAPSGHLPARVWDAYNKGGVGSFNQLMARLINCDL